MAIAKYHRCLLLLLVGICSCGEGNDQVTQAVPVATSSSSTTTTSGRITTTTAVAHDAPSTCSIAFRLLEGHRVGALRFTVRYHNAPGEIRGQGQEAACTTLVRGGFAAYNNCPASSPGCPPLAPGTLLAALVSPEGIEAPAVIARCRYTSYRRPRASDFAIEVTEASNVDLEATKAVVAIGDVPCGLTTSTVQDDFGTTTSSLPDSTPTTMAPTPTLVPTTMHAPPPTSTVTTTTVALPPSTVGLPTTTIEVDGALDVEITLIDAVRVAALGIELDYAGVAGRFAGSGADVHGGGTLQCDRLAGDLGGLADDDRLRRLRGGFVSLNGFFGPALLARCLFLPAVGTRPRPEDFTVRVDDASDVDLRPVVPTPRVAVSRVSPHEP